MAQVHRGNAHKCGIDFALNTATNVPAVGLGTCKLPREKAKDTVIKAFHNGYRHFDCAIPYGNQPEIGEAFQELLVTEHIPRGDLFITSKLWNTNHRRHNVYEDIDSTLKELHLHHLDLYLMHWPLAFTHGYNTIPRDVHGNVLLDDVPLQETWKAMEEMYKDGKARAIGVSNFTLPLLQQLESTAEVMPSVLQIELHPYLQQPELIRYCRSRGIHVTAHSPLGSPDKSKDINVLDDPVLKRIGSKYDKTPGQIALKWSVEQNVSVIPKASTVEHMQQNLQIFDFELSDEDNRAIAGLDKTRRYVSSQRCFGIPLFPDEKEQMLPEEGVHAMYNGLNTEAK